jgi:PadR family transcriptional regulator PadR
MYVRRCPVNVKGSLPMLILNALSSGAGYGYQIAKEIKERSTGVLDFQEGSLYPALHKLAQQGLIEPYTATVDGRERRYYRLTEKGAKELARERKEWFAFVRAVNTVLEGEA